MHSKKPVGALVVASLLVAITTAACSVSRTVTDEKFEGKIDKIEAKDEKK